MSCLLAPSARGSQVHDTNKAEEAESSLSLIGNAPLTRPPFSTQISSSHSLLSQVVHDKRKGSRPLLAHLDGTRALLEAAGYPESVCLAGLMHSVYGTNKFRLESIVADEEGRRRVREAAGEDAERLAFMFCSVRRPATLNAALGERADGRGGGGDVELAGRGETGLIRVSPREFEELVAVEVANCLEQDLQVLGLHPLPTSGSLSPLLDPSTPGANDPRRSSSYHAHAHPAAPPRMPPSLSNPGEYSSCIRFVPRASEPLA